MFATGNGGLNGDSCAFNGYVNSIYTIAISGVNWDGSVPAYAEPCAGVMAVTYGQDVFTHRNIKPSLVSFCITVKSVISTSYGRLLFFCLSESSCESNLRFLRYCFVSR